jgi:hypothetical protein
VPGKLTVTVDPHDIALYTAVYAFGVPVEVVVEVDDLLALPHPRARGNTKNVITLRAEKELRRPAPIAAKGSACIVYSFPDPYASGSAL